jgi:hypothetical protein
MLVYNESYMTKNGINNTFESTTNDIYYSLQERLPSMDLALMMKDLVLFS